MADGTAPPPSRDDERGQLMAPTAGEPASARSTARGRTAAGSVGVLLDGRYRLLQRRTKDGPWATWDGEDDQLLRPVVITVVSGPSAAEAVDAARRSATLEDERLPHLLDVGLERAVDGTALGWVVTERSPGRTLAELLREAPLPAARARALVGEAAAVLARASRAGLHHRRLEPTALALTADGGVSVLGLEIAAAAAGLPARTPAETEREDAEGLVRVLYAALTGLWPAGRCGALGAAPTGRGGSPVTPGELAAGVPYDIDALCSAVLGPYREGPATPAEVAAALAPWGSSTGPVTRTGLGIPATEAPGAWTTPDASAGAAAAAAGAWASAPARARLGGGPGLHFSGGDADDEAPVHQTRASRRAAQRRAEREAERAAAGQDAFEALLGPVTGPRSRVEPSAPGTQAWQEAPPSATVPVASPAAPGDDDASTYRATRHLEPPARPWADQRPSAPHPPHPPHPPAATAPVEPSTAPARTTPFSDTDATDWAGTAWGHAPAGAAPVTGGRRRGTDRGGPRGDHRSAPRHDHRLEAPASHHVDDVDRYDDDDHPEHGRRRRGAVLAVLALLVLALVAAVVVLAPRVPQIAGALGIAPSDTSAPGTSAPATPGASAPAAQDPASPTAPEASAAAGEITSAQAQDPFGDGTENDESASRAVDGDPATAWRSSTYSNAALGNLKRGVGLGLVLGDGTTPSTVTSLQLRTEGTGGRVEVRSSPDGGYAGSTVVATAQAGTGGATVDVPLDEPTSTTHLLLWFTELPQTPTGYTAVVDEVSAR